MYVNISMSLTQEHCMHWSTEWLCLCAQLGKMRYATVCEFHGRKMVNIREYYEADEGLRPGKKGYCNYLNTASC